MGLRECGIAHAVSPDIGTSREGCILSGLGTLAPNDANGWQRGKLLKWQR